MNNDSRYIFEAYLTSKKQLISEIPAFAAGDLNIPGEKLKSAPGGGYGLKKAAAKTGKSLEEVTNELVKKIQTVLFKPENHTVDGVEYNLYYPGNEMKLKNDLQNLVQSELGVGKTEAGYTARILRNMLNIVVKDENTGGIAVKPEKLAAAVATAVKPVKTETVYEIDKSVKIGDKALRALVLSLPDEDVHEKEILGVLKNALSEYNDKPGIEPLKIKSFDLLDSLKEAGVVKEKQVEKQQAEGEGTGEVETMDEIPDGDDTYMTAKKEFGFKERPFDAGGFSYGD